MTTERSALLGVLTLLLAINFAKCDPSAAFSFHPRRVQPGATPVAHAEGDVSKEAQP